jgi:hypothetical protein
VRTEAYSILGEASYGERRRGRSKSSSNRGQHCGKRKLILNSLSKTWEAKSGFSEGHSCCQGNRI